MSTDAKLSLPFKTLDTANPDEKNVLEKGKAAAGFVPNMYAAMVNSPGLLDTYLTGYEHFREKSGFTPAEQEVVLLTISYENGCDYCMAAHSMIADKMSKVPHDVLKAVRENGRIADPRLAALGEFTRTMVSSRGLPDPSDLAHFLAAGFTEKHVLEIILAIAVKTLSNYSNHLFHTPVDDAFSAYKWQK